MQLTERINIYNQDCLEAMKAMPDNAYELAIVDPPYGIGNFNHRDYGIKWEYDWNDAIPSKDYFDQLKRVSREQIIWGANYYNCFSGKGRGHCLV